MEKMWSSIIALDCVGPSQLAYRMGEYHKKKSRPNYYYYLAYESNKLNYQLWTAMTIVRRKIYINQHCRIVITSYRMYKTVIEFEYLHEYTDNEWIPRSRYTQDYYS